MTYDILQKTLIWEECLLQKGKRSYFGLLTSSTDAYNLLSNMQLGINTVPVLVGPVSYLLLSKPAAFSSATTSLH